MRPWWLVALVGCLGPEPVGYDPTEPTVVVAVVDPGSDTMLDEGNVVYVDDERRGLRVDAPSGFESWMFELDTLLIDLGLERGAFPSDQHCAGCGCRWLPEPTSVHGPNGSFDEAPGWYTNTRIAPMPPSACRGRAVLADDDGAPQRCGDRTPTSPEQPNSIAPPAPPCIDAACGEEAFVLQDCQPPARALLGAGCVTDFSDCPSTWPSDLGNDVSYVDATATPSGNGTRSAPFRTLEEALMAGSTTIAVAAGEYLAPVDVDREVHVVGICADRTSFGSMRFTGGWPASIDDATVTDVDATRGTRVELRNVVVTGSLAVTDCAALSATNAIIETPVAALGSTELTLYASVLTGGVECGPSTDLGSIMEQPGERQGWSTDCRDDGRVSLTRTAVEAVGATTLHGVGCTVNVAESLLSSTATTVYLEEGEASLDDSVLRNASRKSTIVTKTAPERVERHLELTRVVIDAEAYGVSTEGAPISLVDTEVRTGCDVHAASIHVRGNGTNLERVAAIGPVEMKDVSGGTPNQITGSDFFVDDCPERESEVVRIERASVEMARFRIRSEGSDGLSLQDGTSGDVEDLHIEGGRTGIIGVIRDAVFRVDRVTITGTANAVETNEGVLELVDARIDGPGTGTAIVESVGEYPRRFVLDRFVVTGYEDLVARDPAAILTTAEFSFTEGWTDARINDAYFVFDSEACAHRYIVMDGVVLD